MGAVPVLLMVTLFGTLSAQPHLDVCGFQAVDVQRLSGAHLHATNHLDDGLQEREALAVQAFGHDVAVYYPVSNDTVAGNSTVRETARAANANYSQLQQADDSSPVAIPKLVSDSAGCILNAASNSRVIAVWKPDNSGVAGSGFSFPSVPPSLAEAGQTFTQNVDRAGRPIDPAASALGATNGTTLPSTTVAGPPSFPVPPFTGAGVAPAGSAAANTTAATSTRAVPPVSSRDAATRTTNWEQFPLPTTATAATVSNPSVLGVNSGGAANTASSGQGSSTGVSPLLPTDTFGRTPTGLTPLNAGRAVQTAPPSVPQSPSNAGTAGFASVPTTDSILNRNLTANPNTATGFGTGSTASRPAREGSASNNLNSTRPASSGQPKVGLPVGQPPIGRFGVNPSPSFSLPSTTTYPATGASAPSTTTSGFPVSRPDARLSAAQLAAGAWSVDAFGQPVDRAGQRIATATGMNHGHRLNQQAQPPGAAGFAGAFPNQAANHLTNVRPDNGIGNAETHRSTHMLDQGASRFSHPTSNGKPNQARGETLVSTTESIPRITETQVIETESVTTQPLFNGLLLISVVANIYLIFWLKNLRLQYHEMVAAKRMASSNASSS